MLTPHARVTATITRVTAFAVGIWICPTFPVPHLLPWDLGAERLGETSGDPTECRQLSPQSSLPHVSCGTSVVPSNSMRPARSREGRRSQGRRQGNSKDAKHPSSD